MPLLLSALSPAPASPTKRLSPPASLLPASSLSQHRRPSPRLGISGPAVALPHLLEPTPGIFPTWQKERGRRDLDAGELYCAQRGRRDCQREGGQDAERLVARCWGRQRDLLQSMASGCASPLGAAFQMPRTCGTVHAEPFGCSSCPVLRAGRRAEGRRAEGRRAEGREGPRVCGTASGPGVVWGWGCSAALSAPCPPAQACTGGGSVGVWAGGSAWGWAGSSRAHRCPRASCCSGARRKGCRREKRRVCQRCRGPPSPGWPRRRRGLPAPGSPQRRVLRRSPPRLAGGRS